MANHEWHFRLHGEKLDLANIEQLFSTEAKIIRDANDRSQLVLELPYESSSVWEARNAADELLARMNGIAQIDDPNHQNVVVEAWGSKDTTNGPVQQYLYTKSDIKGRARVSAGLTVTGSGSARQPVSLFGDQCLAAADKNLHLERALYIFGSLPVSWRGLYMVLEAAMDDHGGEAGLIGKGWVPNGQIEDFKAAANSYKALGIEARHGTLKMGVLQAKLTLEDAYKMIRAILERWVKEIV